MCPSYRLEHLLDICPGEVLWDSLVVLCPIFWGTARLISRVVVQACNPTNNGGVFLFLHILAEDPTIPLLGIYPEDVPTGKKDTCSTMFIAALFIIARGWKEPSSEEWIQKMWYIYTMEYYSAIKRNEFMKFLGKWMDLEGNVVFILTFLILYCPCDSSHHLHTNLRFNLLLAA